MKQVPPATQNCRLRLLAALPLVLAGTSLCSAAELPSAPVPQPPSASAPATPPTPASQPPMQAVPANLASLSGIVTDTDGDAIPNARITLTRPGEALLTATTASDGSFLITDLPPGDFTVSIAADSFTPHQETVTLKAGEDRELPEIRLTAAVATASVEVHASPTEIAEAQVKLEEKQRVLGAIPNFYVVYEPHPAPLNPEQKSDLAIKSLVDPINFFLVGVEAGAQQAAGAYAWEQGASGYAKRYAADYGTSLTGDILGNAVLPIVFHQDPRYYYKGTGSVLSRVGYALANAVVCKGDSGHWEVNYSGILGGLAASGIANAYYPAPNRTGAGAIFLGGAVGTGLTAISNIMQEFVVRKLTPHLPPVSAPIPPGAPQPDQAMPKK